MPTSTKKIIAFSYLHSYFKKTIKGFIAFISVFILSMQAASSQPFVHPGLLHKQEDLDRMKTKVAANAQPWKAGFDKLAANSHSSSTYALQGPVATVYRGTGSPENFSKLFNDAAAAYATALRWYITGDVAFANKSIEILNAWGSTLTAIHGSPDKYLASGIYGYQLANAAEIMRTYSGWTTSDFTQFKNMMLNVFYPMNHDFLLNHNGACSSHYWANWDMSNMATMLSIGVLIDRRDIYNEAVNYFKFGTGNGAILKLVPYVYDSLAQYQESGRDQGHTLLGVGLAGSFCEMAWNQNDDLYGYDNNRLLKTFEYIAKYNLGYDVPFTTYTNCDPVTQTVVSANGRGGIRPVWEMVYNHYVNRKGLNAKYCALYAQIVRPEGGGGNYGPNSGGYDQLGYGTLAYTLETASKPNNQTITFPAIANKNIGDADFSPGATASSGLAVVYSSSNPSVATVNGNGTIHVLQPGTTIIYAQQSGDAFYNAAPLAQQTLTVNNVPGSTNGTWTNTTGLTSATISSTSGSPILTWPGQTFAIGDVVKLTTIVPGGFTVNTPYNVIAISGNTIQLSNAVEGTPINATTSINNGTGQRFMKWLTPSNWSSSIVAKGTHSIATFSGSSFANVPGVTLDDNVTIGTLNYTSSGTGELHIGNGSNNGKLTFSTINGTPLISMDGTGARKLFIGEVTNGSKIPLSIAGSQGLNIVTPVYATSASYAGVRLQAGIDWSGFAGGLTLLQGAVELHNSTPTANGADNVLLPPQRLTIGTDGTAIVLFNGANLRSSRQTIGALDGTTDAYIASRNSLTASVSTLIIGADNLNGAYDGTFCAGPTSSLIDSGRIDIIKTGTGTQVISGVIYDGITGTGHTSVTLNNGKLILSGNNLYQGPTTINSGILAVNASLASAITINVGTLQGTGSTTMNVIAGTGSGAGATIAPGNSIGTFTVGNSLTLRSDATYAIEMSSSMAIFDKLVANGVMLTSAKFTITDISANASLPVNAVYTIVDNTSSTAVNGTFNNLPEGSTVIAGSNIFQLSYVGGTGNDVVLTVTGTLPVTILSYNAQLQSNKTVLIQWSTANEINNDFFIIERSLDGQGFSNLKRIASRGSTANAYSFIDNQPFDGNNFYRLTQFDKDGNAKVLGIRLVKLLAAPVTLSVFPNPTKNGTFSFQLNNQQSGIYIIELFNSLGQKVYSNIINYQGGTTAKIIKVGTGVAKGIYQLKVSGGVSTTIQQVVLE